MKNQLFLLLVLATIFVSCNHKTSMNELILKDSLYYSVEDTLKPFTGGVLDKYKTGEDSLVAVIDSGKFVGNYLTFHKNGLVKDSVLYEKGEMIKFHSFTPNGKLVVIPSSKLIYENGIAMILNENKQKEVFNGVCSNEYERENLKVNSSVQFIYGLKEGTKIGKYSNGKIESISKYIKGKEDGQSLTFFANGDTSNISNFKMGIHEGRNCSFMDSNHQKWYDDFYINNDIATRTSYYYNEDGTLDKKCEEIHLFVNNHYQMNSFTFKDINKNGNIMLKGAYNNGNKDGVWIWYSSSGSVESEAKFRNGEALRKCDCCGRWYVQSEGFSRLPSGFGRWREWVGPDGGPYCSKHCAYNCY